MSVSWGIDPLLERAYRGDVGVKGVEVNQEIDTSVSKCLHASVVVRCIVNVVDAQSIGAELFHQLNIALALFGVDEGILRAELVRDALHKVLRAIFMKEFVALDLNGINRFDGGGESSEESCKDGPAHGGRLMTHGEVRLR